MARPRPPRRTTGARSFRQLRRFHRVGIPDKVFGTHSYIRSIIDAVEVDDRTIRIIGSKDVLQAAVAGKQTENGNVRGFVRKWRAIQNKIANSYVIEIKT
jgi:hypothetical protein